MAHNKRRVVQQIMEEQSLVLVRNQLPAEWVIHEYAPDYGIDFVVETFKYIDEARTLAETLGEFFFAQMKSVEHVSFLKKEVIKKYNVEKSLREDTSNTAVIDVIAYPLDANEIHTVMSMGTSVPVVLFLADLSSSNIYFICLTDYIEKIILPQNNLQNHTSSVTIYIPVENNITRPEVITHLAFLARRAKFIGAFNKFNYQKSEIEFSDSEEMILRFISIIKSYDFWDAQPLWPILKHMYEEMKRIEAYYLSPSEQRKTIIEQDKLLCHCWEMLDDEEKLQDKKANEIFFEFKTKKYWYEICNLGNLYEEICKEWFLPTYYWNCWSSIEEET